MSFAHTLTTSHDKIQRKGGTSFFQIDTSFCEVKGGSAARGGKLEV